MNNAEHANELSEIGYTVVKGVFNSELIETTRQLILSNLSLFKNTRPTSSAGHIAGFHRYPQFEVLHAQLSNNEKITEILKKATGDDQMVTIGLSDITINRSQQWHNDLLRGDYRKFLDRETCWGAQGGGVYKVLLYLQQGKSLSVIPRSHSRSISLVNDEIAIPKDKAKVIQVPVNSGDVILMDIRLTHRGSTEEEMQQVEQVGGKKILVSTVCGGLSKPLTEAMEIGNFSRMKDWDKKNANKKYVAA